MGSPAGEHATILTPGPPQADECASAAYRAQRAKADHNNSDRRRLRHDLHIDINQPMVRGKPAVRNERKEWLVVGKPEYAAIVQCYVG
jgi:hypothetical protein